jgi:hypothetical protein
MIGCAVEGRGSAWQGLVTASALASDLSWSAVFGRVFMFLTVTSTTSFPPPTSCVCRKPRAFDLMKESRNVGHDGRAARLPFGAVGFAVQAGQPARG